MGKTVVITQAHFLPRLFQLERMVEADVVVIMDDHQFGPHWQRRTTIKTPDGERYLTVPMAGGQRQHIQNVRVAETNWYEKALRTLQQCYGRAPFFKQVQPALSAFFPPHRFLYEMNRALLVWLIAEFGIEAEVVEQSVLGAFPQHKTDLMVAVTKAVGGDAYLSGQAAVQEFYDRQTFEAAGIELLGQDWTCPVYPQLWGEFIPNLSVIDAMFNVGVEGTRKILFQSSFSRETERDGGR